MTDSFPVFMAVPLLAASSNDDDINNIVGVDDIDDDVESTPKVTSKLCFFVGSLIGIISSMTGFLLQQHFQFESILAFALTWSCVTSVTSYLLFYGFFFTEAELHINSPSSLEYYFALGVFLGFCVCCTGTDVLIGMPAQSILLTVMVGILWALLMMYCAGHNASRTRTSKKVLRGTKLPLIMV